MRNQTCNDCKLGQCERCTGIAEEGTPWETPCACAEQEHNTNSEED